MESIRKIVAERMRQNRAKMEMALHDRGVDVWREEHDELMASFDERAHDQDWPLYMEDRDERIPGYSHQTARNYK